jgi:hypothetical protein
MYSEYQIEVCLNPHPWDNPDRPYFWMIAGWHQTEIESESITTSNFVTRKCDGIWCNVRCGWCDTPEHAWKTAFKEHKELIAEGNNENNN